MTNFRGDVETTERPEAVDADAVKLVGTATREILREAFCPLDDRKEYERSALARNTYGDEMTCLPINKIFEQIW